MNVYLSKSNQADPDILINVRHKLKELADVKMAEFKGGVYNTQTPLVNDAMLLIPPARVSSKNNSVILGRGTYDEALKMRANLKPVWIYIKSKFYWIDNLSISNTEDYYNYGRVSYNPKYSFSMDEFEKWLANPALFIDENKIEDYQLWTGKTNKKAVSKDEIDKLLT